MLKWEWSPKATVNFNVKIKEEDWLPTLAKAQFYLACPGVVTPQSHNLVEAMSVGCIPVLSYGGLVPPLEHGVNCISFKDENNLVLRIKEILEMSNDRIASISKNVIEYYDQYLTTATVINLVKEAQGRQSDLYFYNEVIY